MAVGVRCTMNLFGIVISTEIIENVIVTDVLRQTLKTSRPHQNPHKNRSFIQYYGAAISCVECKSFLYIALICVSVSVYEYVNVCCNRCNHANNNASTYTVYRRLCIDGIMHCEIPFESASFELK